MSLVLVPIASAATYLLRPDGTGDYPTIQAAINAAADGDVIELCDGAYTGAGNRDLDYLGKAIVVRSQSENPDACIIDCQASSSDPHRGFLFQQGEDGRSRLEGVSIIHGYMDGGAICCVGIASPAIVRCVLRDNVAPEMGGGLLCEGAWPDLTDCVIRDNSANNGGGICIDGGLPTFLRCSIMGNGALWRGGGMSVVNGSATLNSCTFAGNDAPQGGGIAVFGLTVVTMDHSIIAFSEAGASVYCDDEWYPGIETTCSDVYGNAGGDWVDCLSGQLGYRGNFSADPLFCDPDAGDFHIASGSPCADAPGCGLVGAWPVGCAGSTAIGPPWPPQGLSLRVWPNPAGEAAQIQCVVPSAGERASIAVYDLTGRLVRAFNGGELKGEFVWDRTDHLGRPVGSGAYYLRLRLGDDEVIQRVLVVR